MKLKKLVSLALAGVLALSAFSGCAMGAGGNIKANRGMYTKIVAALDDETTKDIKFVYSNAVAADLQKAAEKEGADTSASAISTWGTNIEANLKDINAGYGDTISSSTDEKDVQKEQQQMFVIPSLGYGAKESYVAEKVAETIDAAVAAASLPEKSGDYGSGKYYYAYSYTAEMGVVEVSDAVTGQSIYGIVIVLHRVPTKTNKT